MQRPIVTFSSIDWDSVWQGHQELMSRLAGRGHPILFVENTGIRRPRLNDLKRLIRRSITIAARTGIDRRPVTGLQLHAPRILPFPYNPVAIATNTALLVAPIRRWLRQFHLKPIVWTYLPTPLVRRVAASLSPDLLVYYCVDNLPASSNLARHVAESEQRLFASADLVLVTSRALKDKAEQYRPRAHLMPSGVSYERFQEARTARCVTPDDIADVTSPVVGYMGGLHRWFDVQLAAAVAERLPRVFFVFVGPRHVDVRPLERLPNVRVLGPRPHDAVARYLLACHAGIVPYVVDEYTTAVFPTKLPEYLAMGLPCVSTALPSVVEFNRRHGELVTIADTPVAFAHAVARAISDLGGERERLRRIQVAETYGWSRKVTEIESLMGDLLSIGPSPMERQRTT